MRPVLHFAEAEKITVKVVHQHFAAAIFQLGFTDDFCAARLELLRQRLDVRHPDIEVEGVRQLRSIGISAGFEAAWRSITRAVLRRTMTKPGGSPKKRPTSKPSLSR